MNIKRFIRALRGLFLSYSFSSILSAALVIPILRLHTVPQEEVLGFLLLAPLLFGIFGFIYSWAFAWPTLLIGLIAGYCFVEKKTSILIWVALGGLIATLNGLLVLEFLPVFIVGGLLGGYFMWRFS